MSTPVNLPAIDALWQRAAQAPHEFDLYHLLRWLDARAGATSPLGRAAHPNDEPLRIGQSPSLAFAPSTLESATPAHGDEKPRASIYSFGLFGPNGPLPLHLTEYARDLARNHDDDALIAFANLFHHRLILLFYRAWADAQPTASLDRGPDARFDRYVASLVHVGLDAQRHRSALPDHARYHMAGHLVRQTANLEGLQKILRGYLRMPVAIVEHVLHWMPVEPSRRTALGNFANDDGRPTLGRGALLGAGVRDAQGKFEIRLGPLTHAQYRSLLPGSTLLEQLRHWVRQYVGVEFVWDLRLLLAAGETASAGLGAAHQLARDSWLGMRDTGLSADDLVFAPDDPPRTPPRPETAGYAIPSRGLAAIQ